MSLCCEEVAEWLDEGAVVVEWKDEDSAGAAEAKDSATTGWKMPQELTARRWPGMD